MQICRTLDVSLLRDHINEALSTLSYGTNLDLLLESCYANRGWYLVVAYCLLYGVTDFLVALIMGSMLSILWQNTLLNTLSEYFQCLNTHWE